MISDGEKIQVIHVYRTYFPDHPGGIQEAIRQIAVNSAAHGIESRIFTLSPLPYPKTITFPEGKVIRSRSWAAPASCDLGGLGAFLQFRKAVRSADIMHFHFPWPFGDLLRFMNRHACPAVMTYHSDILRQRILGYLYKPLMRSMLQSMSAVIATSPGYAQTSKVLCNMVPRERLRIIPLGSCCHGNTKDTFSADLSRLKLSWRPMFLALGVLRYYKGLRTLIKAASSLDADVVIAGSGPEMCSLRQFAQNCGVSNVIFAGYVTDEEKRALLTKCHAFVLSSHLRTEAFGMVLVEAAMFGKPMISCEIGTGTSFVNVHGETGFVVEPNNHEALARAMRRLLNDGDLAARMGAAARARYNQLFSGTILGNSYASLYREIAFNSRGTLIGKKTIR